MAQAPTSLSNSESRLHEAAMAAAGFDDFGDPGYLDALRVFLQAHDARLPAGPSAERDAVAAQVVDLLIGRLYTQAGLKRRPEVRNRPIHRPLFILGLPRTGTTALQHMLMRDPQFQGLQYWLGERPMPRPPRERWPQYPEFQRCQQRIDELFAARPAMKAIHFMAADEVDECRLIMTQCFASTALAWAADIGAYSRWLYATDLTPQYRYYADALRLIGADDDRTWLLKCPHHTLAIDKLLDVFPDARIVFTHRDPVDLVPSVSSLSYELMRGGGDDATLRREIGRRHVEKFEEPLRRTMAVRAANPGRFLDIRFTDYMADPLGAVRGIYAHFDLELTPKAEAAMQGWLDANPKGKHGSHRYTPEDFGLTAEQLRERFSFYDLF